MSKKSKSERPVVKTVRFTAAEDRAISIAAARAGVSFSVYVRECVLARAAPDLSATSRLGAIGSGN